LRDPIGRGCDPCQITAMLVREQKPTADIVGNVIARLSLVLEIVDDRIRSKNRAKPTMPFLALRDDRAIDAAPSADENSHSRQPTERDNQARRDDAALAARRFVQRVDHDRHATFYPADRAHQAFNINGDLLASRNPERLRRRTGAIVERLALRVDRHVDDMLGRKGALGRHHTRLERGLAVFHIG
jgi:hypothetical protein